MFSFILANLDLLLPMLFLMGLAAFFALSETALFSLSRHDLHQLKSHANRREVLVASLRQQSRPLLVTILLANMLCTILFFVLSTLLLRNIHATFGRAAVIVLALAPVILVAYFGEVMPKILGRTFNRRLAPLLAGPLALTMRVAAPAVWLIQGLVITPVHRLIDRPSGAGAFTLDELRHLLSMAEHQGIIDQSENQLLRQVVRLHEIKVRNVMVPRVAMTAFEIHQPISDLLSMFRRSRLSKIPVYDRQIDNMLGVIRAKTFLLERPATTAALRSLIQPVRFTPMSQTLDKLLTMFRQSSFQMAIVVDEYGGVAGLVALEDVVEQLIGDISEPGDTADRALEALAPDRWRASGNLSLLQWSDIFGTQVKTLHASTVAGLLCAVLKRIPQVGDSIAIDHLKMTVETMVGPRIKTVLIELRERPAPEAGAPSVTGKSSPPPPEDFTHV